VTVEALSLRYDYQPTSRQREAHRSVMADELLYGGAAGGGKSRFARAAAVLFTQQFPGAAVLVLRRKFVDLNRPGGMIPEFRREMPHGLGVFNESSHQWRMANGSTIELGYFESAKDEERYQGAEYQLIIVDEAGQFDGTQLDFLGSRLRAAGKVKAALNRAGQKPRIIFTANPGGIGHSYLRRRFVTAVPANTLWRPRPTEDNPNPGTRIYIPARVDDNPHVDESYVTRLQRLNPERRRALLEGDWDSFSGSAFPTFRRDVHVVPSASLPFDVSRPSAWGVDFGMTAPFAAVFGQLYPDGLIVIRREIEAVELTPAQQAARIREAEQDNERTAGRSVPVVLDPSTWTRAPDKLNPPGKHVGGNLSDVPPPGSIASFYWDEFPGALEKGHNARLDGWALLRDRLEVRRDGLPRLLIADDCPKLISKLPLLPRSQKNPEDVDTKADDHLADATRYLLMHFARRFNEVQSPELMAERSRQDQLSRQVADAIDGSRGYGDIGTVRW
jgi:hypothetical protein